MRFYVRLVICVDRWRIDRKLFDPLFNRCRLETAFLLDRKADGLSWKNIILEFRILDHHGPINNDIGDPG